MLRHLAKLLMTEASGNFFKYIMMPIKNQRPARAVIGALSCSLLLAACASSQTAESTLDTAKNDLAKGAETPQSALSMRRGLSLPPGVLETVRPAGFDPTPTDLSDQNLLPGVYVAEDQYDDTYMINRRDDPILDAAMAELESAEPIPEDAQPEFRAPIEIPANLSTAALPIVDDVAATPMEAGTYGIHITSYGDSDSVRPGLAHILSMYGRELEGLRALVNLETVAGKGLFYRLKFGPFASYEAALARCDRIKMLGEYCNVVSFDGEPF